MDIKSFGCSFIYGSELADDGHGTLYATPSKFTWPSLLAKQLGYGYQCYAYPGSGNLQIMEKVLNQTANIESAVFIIGWSWIDRFDYVDATTDKWRTIMPLDDTSIAKTYYRDLHSEYRDKLSTLMSIKIAIDTLKSKNLTFIMTYMDDLMFDNKWHSSAAINELQEYIHPYMNRFDGHNFLEWSKKNNYPIGQAAHPLEQAHSAAADYMLEVLQKKIELNIGI